MHWVFNHGTHLTLVISDANDLVELTKEEILEIAATELKKYLNIPGEKITNFKFIKEKRATFVPSIETLDKRPLAITKFANLFLAGDWIETGLPSTIESAVKSGRVAAELILQK